MDNYETSFAKLAAMLSALKSENHALHRETTMLIHNSIEKIKEDIDHKISENSKQVTQVKEDMVRFKTIQWMALGFIAFVVTNSKQLKSFLFAIAGGNQ